jgi:hypothetical protein
MLLGLTLYCGMVPAMADRQRTGCHWITLACTALWIALAAGAALSGQPLTALAWGTLAALWLGVSLVAILRPPAGRR